MRQLEVTVTYKYSLEVDDNDPIVREYEGDMELVSDLVNYQFRELPVLKEGVEVIDCEATEWEIE